MALSTPSLLTENVDGTNRASGTSYTTASITPTGSRLVFLVVYLSATTTPAAPTISGCGLTWTSPIDSQVVDVTDSLWVFRGTAASPSTGAVSITLAHNCTQALWKVFEQSGHNATTPIVQSDSVSGTGTAVATSLAAFGAAGNGTILAVGNQGGLTNTITSEGGSWANVGSNLFNNSPNANMHTFWLAGNDTTPTATNASSTDWGAIAMEIAEAGGGPPPATGWGRLLSHERNRRVRTH